MKARNVGLGAVLIVAAALPYLGILPQWTPALATICCLTALSLIGLNLIFGMTGMLALGQAAFMVLPSYISGMLHAYGMQLPIAIALGLVVTIAIARLVAEVFVRLPGIYLAIGTLGFAFLVEGFARAFPSLTGGASGLILEPPVTLSGNAWYVLALAFLALGVVVYAWLVRGGFMRSLKLVRQDELAAEVTGIDVAQFKARIFTIGCAYSAVGGVLIAYYVQVLTPESGGVNSSLESLATTIIGGAGFLFGPVLGSACVQLLFKIAGGADRYNLLIYGLGFFFVMLFAPNGIAGALSSIGSKFGAGSSSNATRVVSEVESVANPLPRAALERERRAELCLRVENVTVNFGGLCALDKVNFDISVGTIAAIIGPNGAGKTTLFNVISGIEQSFKGRLRLENVDLIKMPIHRRAEAIGRSFQVPRLVPELTALENVMARLDHLPKRLTEDERRRSAALQLEVFGLDIFAQRPVSEIALGYHKLIELARASIGNPLLLLLDEPAAGLTTDEIDRLTGALKLLKTRGTTTLVIEHNVDFVGAIADQLLVLENGRVIARGTPGEVIADPLVQTAYFGSLT